MPGRCSLALGSCSLFLILVLAACGGDNGGGPVTPPPPPRIPLAVDDLRVIAGADGAVTLAWTSPALADKAGYAVTYDLRHVPYGNAALDWNLWTRLEAPAGDSEPSVERTHTVTGLTPGAVYAFGLQAANGEEATSGRSNLAVGTAAPGHDTTPPEAVTDLAQVGGTRTSLSVRWSTVGNDGPYGHAPHYQVRYAASPITDETWDQATFAVDISVTGAPSLSHTITGLAAETEYWIAVKASDEAGHVSPLSNVLGLVTGNMRTLFVNVEGTGDFPTIQEAVRRAGPGDVILVGPGRYTWTNQATLDTVMNMINTPARLDSVVLRSSHGPEVTILDAERKGAIMSITGGTVDPPGGERYWTGITVDGFTFTGGYAPGEPSNSDNIPWGGAGLNAHLTDSVIRNCIFTGNEAVQGGGVWIGGQGEAVLQDCLIEGNDAEYGGGVFLGGSEPRYTVERCVIRDNHSTYLGGGLLAVHCRFTIRDCLIVGNDSTDRGGGLVVFDIELPLNAGGLIERCTIADNEAAVGAGLHLEIIPDLTITNTIVAGNRGSSAIKGVRVTGLAVGCNDLYGNPDGAAWPGGTIDLGGNIEADPLFCDRTDYRLRSDSPALAGCGQMGARGKGCSP